MQHDDIFSLYSFFALSGVSNCLPNFLLFFWCQHTHIISKCFIMLEIVWDPLFPEDSLLGVFPPMAPVTVWSCSPVLPWNAPPWLCRVDSPGSVIWLLSYLAPCLVLLKHILWSYEMSSFSPHFDSSFGQIIILDWKLFSLTILKTPHHCHLVYSTHCWEVWCHSDSHFLVVSFSFCSRSF